MKLSITTFKIICSLWNYPEEILEDVEYLNYTLNAIDTHDINFNQEEKETAKEEIIEFIKTL
jgi:uncharacterized protein YgfB (UPF0149 family)